MGLNHLVVLFLLGIVHFSLGKECIGCSHKLDINDPTLRKYLSNKLHDLKNVVPKGVSDDKEMELVQVKDAQEKVVTGIEYSYQFEAKGLNTKQMYYCKLTVLTKLWLGPEQVTEYSCHLISNGNERLLPGKEIVIDVRNNPNLEELKSFIGQEIGKAEYSEYVMTVLKYLKATMQLVEGTIIKATAQVGITNCHVNTSTIENTECQHKLRGKQVCEVTIWLKPWMKFKKVTLVKCQPLQLLEQYNMQTCLGCPEEKDPNSPFIKQSLEKVLEKINEKPQTSQKFVLVKINKATFQIVDGSKLTVYFDAQDVNSHKNYSCETVIILPRSGRKEQAIKDFNCTPVSTN